MPNRVFNRVTIKTKSDKDLQEIIDAIRGEGLGRHFIPRTEEVQKDWDLELLYGSNGAEERKEKYGLDKPRDRVKEGFKECPYKQLWYNWQIENWGSKRDFKEKPNWEPDELEPNYMVVSYNSAWTPHLPLWREISKKLQCEVEVVFEEEDSYSGIFYFKNGMTEQADEYNDRFFGRGKRCTKCNCDYDDENPDDRSNQEHTICYMCGEEDD